jgi:hypothetical protein
MNILDIVLGTPYWVWIVFSYLLWVGIQATKPSMVPLWRMSIIPLIFLAWSLSSIYARCIACMQLIGFWIAAITIGVLLGRYLMSRLDFRIDASAMIHLPGSRSTLILSMIFFIVKYGLGVTYAVNPIMRSDLMVQGFDVMVSGFISGIFIGRFGYIVYRYRKG